MLISDKVKNILQVYDIQINTAKDYDEKDLSIIYEKIIIFLSKKIAASKIDDDEYIPCSTDLSKLSEQVTGEFETLGFDGQLEKYSVEYLKTLHQEECYTIAEALIAVARANYIDVPQMFFDIVANYGIITNKLW